MQTQVMAACLCVPTLSTTRSDGTSSTKVGGALAAGGAGAVAGHPEEGTGGPNEGHDHTDGSIHETEGDIDQVGYHSLGGRGQADADTPHYGGLTELRVQNGYAFVGFMSARGPPPNRVFAVLDVSDFTRARNDGAVHGAFRDGRREHAGPDAGRGRGIADRPAPGWSCPDKGRRLTESSRGGHPPG